MTGPVQALHSRFNGRRSRITSLDREDVFAESIKAFDNRTDKLRNIIIEYREKFGNITAGAD